MDGLYTSLSGAMTLETRLRLVAHDLANLNTPGHKRTRIVDSSEYPTVLQQVIEASDPSEFDTQPAPSAPYGDEILNRLSGTEIDFSQGALRLTGADTDLALDGEGFFVVSVDGAERFTRAGSFELDGLGQLVVRVDGTFQPVMGQGGPITIPAGSFDVAEDGRVLDADGQEIATLRLVAFDDPQQLERLGGTLFADSAGTAGQRDLAPGETAVRQRAIELSNADPVMSLVEMIEIQRAYQAVAKSMSTADEATSRRVSLSLNG